MKYGIYVEGQSEMIFVADILAKYSEYNPEVCGFRCVNLRANQYEYRQNPLQGNKESDNYYQIVNVNNDDLVPSKIKDSLEDLIRKGFDIVIGLRDVYGNSYRNITKNQPVVDFGIINRMQEEASARIASTDIIVRLHFAIMEFEAWLLALMEAYAQKHKIKLPELDAFVSFENIYHPTPQLIKILDAAGKDYDKSEQATTSFLSFITKEDYENLRQSGHAPSFTQFIDSLIGNRAP